MKNFITVTLIVGICATVAVGATIYMDSNSESTVEDPSLLQPVETTENRGSGMTGHNTYISFSDDLLDFPEGSLVIKNASVPDVLVKDDEIWVYFVDTETAHQGGSNISAVYSSDSGETWSTKVSINIDGVDEDIEPVDPSLVLLEDGRIRMYYYDFPYGGVKQDTSDFYAATSEDGLNFVVDQMVLSVNSGHTDPDVVYRDNEWFLYYVETGDVNGGIGVAVSDDGLNFENVDYVDALDLKSIPTAIVLENGDIRLYSCLDSSGVSKDGIHFSTDHLSKFVDGKGACDPSIDEFKDGYVLVYKKIEI